MSKYKHNVQCTRSISIFTVSHVLRFFQVFFRFFSGFFQVCCRFFSGFFQVSFSFLSGCFQLDLKVCFRFFSSFFKICLMLGIRRVALIQVCFKFFSGLVLGPGCWGQEYFRFISGI